MYHLELRKFPKRVHRYNMSGPEIGALLLLWVREQVVELGEQKWRPQEAEITVLEGPEVPPREISMARGWRRAEREGRDVTAAVLGEAREHLSGGGASSAETVMGGTGVGGPGDGMALALRLGSLLGPDAARLMDAWGAVRLRDPGLAPSEALARAERELGEG